MRLQFLCVYDISDGFSYKHTVCVTIVLSLSESVTLVIIAFLFVQFLTPDAVSALLVQLHSSSVCVRVCVCVCSIFLCKYAVIVNVVTYL